MISPPMNTCKYLLSFICGYESVHYVVLKSLSFRSVLHAAEFWVFGQMNLHVEVRYVYLMPQSVVIVERETNGQFECYIMHSSLSDPGIGKQCHVQGKHGPHELSTKERAGAVKTKRMLHDPYEGHDYLTTSIVCPKSR